jgi:predicted nucleic acid-binding protein
MRILLDTNVVLDVALEREPFDAAAVPIINASDFDRIHLFITASMATDVYYLVSKSKGREAAFEFLADLPSLVDVCQVDRNVLAKALDSDFLDFEDAVQNAAAVDSQVEFIVTRNKQDYVASPLTVLTPEEFVAAHLA